ncbi:MAG: hypothetical protein ACLR76_12030, partial [Alistipes sp.]
MKSLPPDILERSLDLSMKDAQKTCGLQFGQLLYQQHIESQQLPEFPRNHDTGKAVGRVVQIVAESVLSDTEQLPNDERVASAVT